MIYKLLFYLLLFPFTYAFAKDEVIGKVMNYSTKYEDNFYDLARKFDLGIDELIRANPGIDPWMPGANVELIIPTMHILPSILHQGIIINRSELRLYFFAKNSDLISTFPVSIGISDHETPTGMTVIIAKQLDPYWITPPSMRLDALDPPIIIPPGTNNPLGKHALYLGWQNIIIHSTNKPWSIGTYGSHGCIRLYPEDAKLLFQQVRIGTSVKVIDEPIKLGSVAGDLYIEVLSLQQLKIPMNLLGKLIINPDLVDIKARIITKYGKDKLNEELLDELLNGSTSIPVKINK